jgi:hypothetical protein
MKLVGKQNLIEKLKDFDNMIIGKRSGVYYSFMYTGSMLTATGYCIDEGKWLNGIIFGIATIAGLGSAYYFHKKS